MSKLDDHIEQSSTISHQNVNLESSLCFSKEMFYAPSFDVDTFLSLYKREQPLERLRDDLNIFLKVLEMSMSELINKDYPDFVNLSTNLVDLDKAINELRKPLETMKNDVDGVKNSIESEKKLIMSKLNEKLMIEKRKIVLKLLMNWERSLKVTNEMIGENKSSTQKITGEYLERVAFEFCQLTNSLSICSGEKESSLTQNNEIKKLSQMLEKMMQELFLTCLNSNQQATTDTSNEPETKQQLRHCLKSYLLLSKQRQAEQLFTEHKVKPFLAQFLNEDYLEKNIKRLSGVYEKIIEFIESNGEFLKIANEIKKSNASSPNEQTNTTNEIEQNRNEFNFVINSVWSQIVNHLDLNLNSIFSPADPDLFHENFLISMEFLSSFELKCGQFDHDIKRKLFGSHAYKYFIKKWPIQVYFQIRFQEIVGKFEEDLAYYNDTLTNATNGKDELDTSEFYLKISTSLFKQATYCWNESQCFLKCLLGQFWKLNLQLIARYVSFFSQIYEAKIKGLEHPASSLNANETTQRAKTPTEFGNEPHTNVALHSTSSFIQSNSKQSVNEIDFAFMLLCDTNEMCCAKLQNFFDAVIAPLIRSTSLFKEIQPLKEAFNASIEQLSELQMLVNDFLVKTMVEKCLSHLKNANDIPRLYRRTNREVPKTSSFYIGLSIDLLFEFKQTNLKYSTGLLKKCVEFIIDTLCTKFQAIATDLLESVRKMEDSLKKLQRVRKTNASLAANLSSVGGSSSSTMSDDDKIRLQLYLDVEEFGKQLVEKFDGYKGGKNFDTLLSIVQLSNTSSSSS